MNIPYICEKCGNAIDENSNVCDFCGNIYKGKNKKFIKNKYKKHKKKEKNE